MRTPNRTPKGPAEPVIDRSEDPNAALPEGDDINKHLSAEDDVSDSLDDLSVHRFDDLPQDGPLNFDDGTDMGHPRGNTVRAGGTWQAEGGDSGDLKPPTALHSDRKPPKPR